MGFFLLGIFAILEIALIVVTITKQREKTKWLKNRVIARGAEVAVFILALLLPQISWDFRFKICFFILLIRVAFAMVSWLIKRKKAAGEKSKFGVIVNAVTGIIVLAISLVPSILFTGYAGLETSGKYQVKHTQAILVDESRVETFETDGSNREVPIHFYYPETENVGKNTFPLVIFSHGAFGYYQSNSSTYMELASNGYVVISLDHPYHSFFTEDTEGNLITVNPDFLQEVMLVNEENVTEEEIIELSHKWLEIRTADINFVLDSMENVQEEGIDSPVWFIESDETKEEIQKILSMTDTDKIGLMGHSMGGAASVSVGRYRQGIDAVIDLDGTMLGERISCQDGKCEYIKEPYPVPVLAVDNEEHNQEGITMKDEYVNYVVLKNAVDSTHTYFAGSGHMNFTDLPLFSPILSSLLGTGTVDETECIETMNDVILIYFDYYLKGQGELNIKECY